MKILITLFFIGVATLSIIAQSNLKTKALSGETKRIVNKIAKVNVVMNEAIGYAGSRPKQYDNFEALQQNATIDELIQLTDYDNSTVRCYAFWALSYHHDMDLFPIVVKHIQDTMEVMTLFGCIGGAEKVGDFFINIVTPKYFNLNSKKLSDIELSILDSILIYTTNGLEAKSNAILKAKPTESLYLELRRLALNGKHPEALVTLAKYQKREDVELILNSDTNDDAISYIYKAITQFPHPDFFPFLKKELFKTLDKDRSSNSWSYLYQAIAAYQNEEAVKLLEIPFTKVKHDNIKEYHLNFIMEALRIHKNQIYDALLWRLWQEENRITIDVFDYLSSKNPERALILAKKSLENTKEYYKANLSFRNYDDFDAIERLIGTMLSFVWQKENEVALALIRKNIKEANVHLYPVIINKVIDIQDNSFVEPLLARLQIEDNAHIYLKIVDALIAYNDENINQQILDILNSNPALITDWGGKELEKKLKENHIKH